MIEFKSFSAYCIFACSWLQKTSRAFQALPKDVKFPAPINSDVTINMQVETSCCCIIHLLAITSAHFSHSLYANCNQSKRVRRAFGEKVL
jgi:hypothetical protein